MAKVLYVVPDGDDLGGIYTSTENLLQGFREAGHKATFAMLRPTRSPPRDMMGYAPRPGSYVGQGTGYHLHSQYGWQGPYYSLGDQDSLRSLVELGNEHDCVVWGAMFGLRNKVTEGNTDWVRLFRDIKKPHVGMIRDDHLQDRYPWVSVLERWIVGWACVQRSSFDSCAGLVRPRAIIYSGHDVRPTKDKVPVLKDRTNQLLMVHTFKSWKRGDRLVAAVPHLRHSRVVLGGQGIEYFYMASKTKCKARYYCTPQSDPNAKKGMLKMPIWRNAMLYGNMKHLGNLTAEQRTLAMRHCRFFVDLSWRQGSTGQINRTIVEAIQQGCVPIVIPRFLTGDDAGAGELFQSGVHFLPAPKPDGCSPLALAQHLDYCVTSMPDKDYTKMQQAGLKLIQRFDRRVAAQQLVDLALHPERRGTYDDYGKPKPDPKLINKGRSLFLDVFGALR